MRCKQQLFKSYTHLSVVCVCLFFPGIPACLGWCWDTDDAVAFVSQKGPLLLWTISGPDSGVSVHKEAHGFVSDVSIFRWHTQKKGKVVFGHIDGSISLFQPGKYLINLISSIFLKKCMFLFTCMYYISLRINNLKKKKKESLISAQFGSPCGRFQSLISRFESV